MSKTVENSYPEERQLEVKKKLPVAIKAHIIIFSFLVGLHLILGVLSDVGEYKRTSFLTDILIIRIIVWTIFAGIFFGLYMQLLRRKNWARITIGILTIPLGLILLLSEEARSYCLQNEKED